MLSSDISVLHQIQKKYISNPVLSYFCFPLFPPPTELFYLTVVAGYFFPYIQTTKPCVPLRSHPFFLNTGDDCGEK